MDQIRCLQKSGMDHMMDGLKVFQNIYAVKAPVPVAEMASYFSLENLIFNCMSPLRGSFAISKSPIWASPPIPRPELKFIQDRFPHTIFRVLTPICSKLYILSRC